MRNLLTDIEEVMWEGRKEGFHEGGGGGGNMREGVSGSERECRS